MKVVQVGHACQNAGRLFNEEEQTNLVVFSVKNEAVLTELPNRLRRHGIESVMFYEPDNDLGYTAICTQAVPEIKRKYFKKYKLLEM